MEGKVVIKKEQLKERQKRWRRRRKKIRRRRKIKGRRSKSSSCAGEGTRGAGGTGVEEGK